MSLKKLLLVCLTVALTTSLLKSQTTLEQGDIWLIGMGAQFTPDEFTFVALVDLESGTEIFFSDQERSGGSADSTHPTPGTNDAIVKYTAPSGGLKAGTVVKWSAPSSGQFSVAASGGGAGDIALVFNSGDKVIAYQATTWDSNDAVYLAALGNNASYGPFPAYFTNAINFGTNEDGEYSGDRNDLRANLITSISDTANWTWANGSDQITPLTETEFNVGYYWDGAAWTPSNPGGVGSSFDDNVIVDGTGATFSGNVTTNGDIIVEAGATMDFGANTVAADSVLIRADATGRGQVKGAVTADVEFQTYLTSTGARWFNLGLPVGGAISNIALSSGVIRTAADLDSASSNIYYYDPNNANAGTSQGTWTPAADGTPAADANGWSVYLGGGGIFGTLPITVSAYGTLNSGSFGPTISTANGGWNFVNNPYAGTIDWEEVINDNPTLEQTYYIRDVENGWWRSYNASTNQPADSSFIPAGQAFFVQTSAPTTLDFQEDQVDLTVERALIRSQMPTSVMLKVKTTDRFSDFTVVSLQQGATDGRDPYIDGEKRMNYGTNVPSLYSVMGNESLVYNIISNQFSKKSIPLNLEHSLDDDLTMVLDFDNLGAGMSIVLEDKLSGDMIDLRQQNYTFRHLAANDADRFVLHLSQNSVGIDEEAVKDGIFAYMNSNKLMVNLETINGDLEVQLFDMGGKMLVNEGVSGGQVTEVAMPRGANGVYLLKVVANGQVVHSQKIMK